MSHGGIAGALSVWRATWYPVVKYSIQGRVSTMRACNRARHDRLFIGGGKGFCSCFEALHLPYLRRASLPSHEHREVARLPIQTDEEADD